MTVELTKYQKALIYSALKLQSDRDVTFQDKELFLATVKLLQDIYNSSTVILVS